LNNDYTYYCHSQRPYAFGRSKAGLGISAPLCRRGITPHPERQTVQEGEDYGSLQVPYTNISAWVIEVEEGSKKGFALTGHTELFLQLDGNDCNYYFVGHDVHEIVAAIIAVELKEELRMDCEWKTLLVRSLLDLYDPSRDVVGGHWIVEINSGGSKFCPLDKLNPTIVAEGRLVSWRVGSKTQELIES
jgi:hypothetical protein